MYGTHWNRRFDASRNQRLPRLPRLFVFLLVGLLCAAVAQARGDQPYFLDPDKKVELLDQGPGWRLLRIYPVQDPDQAEVVVALTPKGLSSAPLPASEIDDLRLEFGDDASPNDMIVVHQGVAESIANGEPLPESFQPYAQQGVSGCFGWDDKQKTLDWTFDGWDTSDDFTLGGGVTGNYQVDLPVTGQATAIVDYRIKKELCIPYKIRFERARVFGQMQLQGDSLLTAQATVQGHWEKEWKLAEPYLGGFVVWLGPVPIDFKFYLPIDAGVSLDVAVTGSLAIDADFGGGGTFDYTCDRDTCWGSHDFDSFDVVDITSGLELEIDAQVWARAMVRVDVWSKAILNAAAGARGFVDGHLWGYYGNACGDADGDGVNETVEALAAEARAGYNLAFSYGGILLSDNYWESDGGRVFLGWTDLLGAGGSTALSPMIQGPSLVEAGTPTEYTLRMRPCYPYDDAVNLVMSPGSWSGSRVIQKPQSSDPAMSSATIHGTFNPLGATTLRAEARRDAQGRTLQAATTQPIEILTDLCNGDTTQPTVWISSPTDGITLPAGPVTISATATDDTGVEKVEFLIDGVLIGTDTSAPYAFTWNATAAGTYRVTARAHDPCGNIRNRRIYVTITTVCPNDTQPPTVSLDAPVDGASLGLGNVSLAANASDPSGIALVEFLVGGAVVASDSTAPYSATWNATQEGGYQLQARAIDTCGNVAVDAALVTVDGVCGTDTSDPWVSMTYPTASSPLTQGTIVITADAGDGGFGGGGAGESGVEKVQFFVDGVLRHADFTAPYSYAWDVPAPGTYLLKVRAVDECGKLEAVTREVTVGPRPCDTDTVAPTVAVTSPVDGALLQAGDVTIAATASDASGIGSVEFFVDGVLVGEDTIAPYSASWNVGTGDHELEAVATDHCGLQSSDDVAVTVEPAPPNCSLDSQSPFISMTYPTSTSALTPGFVTIQASASDASGIDRVQFFVDGVLLHADFTAPYTFDWNASPGVHTLKVRALDTCGNLAAFTRTVTVGDPAGCPADSVKPTITLLSPVDGATLEAGQVMLLEADAVDTSGVEKVQFFLGTQLLGADFTPPYTLQWTPPAGAHAVKARSWDNCGNFKADTHQVTAQ